MNPVSSSYSELANWDGSLSRGQAAAAFTVAMLSAHSSPALNRERELVSMREEPAVDAPNVTEVSPPLVMQSPSVSASVEENTKSIAETPPTTEPPSPLFSDIEISAPAPHEPHVARSYLSDLALTDRNAEGSTDDGDRVVIYPPLASAHAFSPSRRRVCYVEIPPLPYGVKKSHYKRVGTNFPSPEPNGSGKTEIGGSTSVADDSFPPSGSASDLFPPPSPSVSVSTSTKGPPNGPKRKYASAEKGKGQARSPTPPRKKPRLHKRRPDVNAHVDIETLHTFDLDFVPPEHIDGVALFLSLRHLWTPSVLAFARADLLLSIPAPHIDVEARGESEQPVLEVQPMAKTSRARRKSASPKYVSETPEPLARMESAPLSPNKSPRRNVFEPPSTPAADPELEMRSYIKGVYSSGPKSKTKSSKVLGPAERAIFPLVYDEAPVNGGPSYVEGAAADVDLFSATRQAVPTDTLLPMFDNFAGASMNEDPSLYPWKLGSEGSRLSSELHEASSQEYAGDGTIDPSLLCGTTSAELSPSPLFFEGETSLPEPEQAKPEQAKPMDASRELRPVRRIKKARVRADILSSYDQDSDEDFSPASVSVYRSKSEPYGRGKTRSVAIPRDASFSMKPQADNVKPAPLVVSLAGYNVVGLSQQERTFCHQCRNTTNRQKMSCSTIQKDGRKCPRLFCWRCIALRYADVVFDVNKEDFVCPFCQNRCSCTACCAKRGETYVSVVPHGAPARRPRVQRPHAQDDTDIVPRSRARKAATTRSARCKEDAGVEFSRDVVTAPAQYWGTVYSLSGERLGTGFRDGSGVNRIIVARAAPVGARKRVRSRSFVGVAQDWWGIGSGKIVDRQLEGQEQGKREGKGKGKESGYGRVRTFIGKRSVLFAPLASSDPMPLDTAYSPSSLDMFDVPRSADFTAHFDEAHWPYEGGEGVWSESWHAYQYTAGGLSIDGGPSMQLSIALDEIAIEKAVRAGLGAL